MTLKKKIIAYNRVEKPVLEDLQNKYDVHFFKDIDTKKDPDFLEQLQDAEGIIGLELEVDQELLDHAPKLKIDRKSTRLNSSHVAISYAVFCLKKKKNNITDQRTLQTR